MNGEKERIRERYLKKRSAIRDDDRKSQSAAVLRQCSSSSFFLEADLILAFSPLPEEIDISGIRGICEEAGKRIAYPKVSGEDMDFYEVFPGEPLSEGVFHVKEPVLRDFQKPIAPERAICLTPGAVFDGFGNRYGY